MAYSKRNRLKRIVDIQEIYLEKQAQGVPTMNIFRMFIKDQYRISERCFFNYMAINAKKELKELDQIEKSQLSIF